jgi:TIR domain
VLERMMQLAERGRSYEFLNRLHESHIMMLGVSFPDWLARSLIRISRQRPLWDSRNCIEVVVDSAPLQADFARFIRAFSPSNSLVFDRWSPADFVSRLHEQWFETYPETRSGISPSSAPKREVRPIFISYANEDLDCAIRFADALLAAGLEVWFDRRGGLRGGDDYDKKIAGAVRDACAVVLLISQHSNVNSDRYFRDEWALAIARQPRFAGLDRAFITPVVIDGSDVEKLRYVRDEIKKLHADRAEGGVPSTDLIARLKHDQATYETR